ncbi:MAG: acyl-CoA dehydrogenase family protein [Beijerinckiaceae bacterium]|nr:acyl-CoA dehydrogenase family protein [Beijerinckiaceae bacterium]
MSLAFADRNIAAQPSIAACVRDVTQKELPQLVDAIDKGSLYPADFLRAIGAAGAFAGHTKADASVDLNPTIDAMSEVSEVCGATGFMTWCQDTLVWYIANTENDELKSALLAKTASGAQLGGTGLSNPMKSFFGIEKLKLKGKRVDGGYSVSGALPWVSNLGDDHMFGTIFEREDGEKVMFIADCANPNIDLLPCDPFLAMDGTGTYGIHFKDAFVPDSLVLAHAAMPFVKKIRAGFILLQAGMAVGVTRDCISIMERTKSSLGHVNKFLNMQQPEDFTQSLMTLDKEVRDLASMPYETSASFWRRVVQARLDAGDLTMAAAHATMLHTGARGYLMSNRAQRRMREAYFVGIVTPATKQLHKMLAEMND